MECINGVTLLGTVGFVRRQVLTEDAVTTFSLMTTYEHTNKEGEKIVETAWHTIEAWDSAIGRAPVIEKGAKLMVCGRIRYSKYTSADNVERTTTDIVAWAVAPVRD